MSTLSAFRAALDKFSTRMALIGAYALFLAALLVCADVFMRSLIAVSIIGSDEVSGYALAAATSWAACYTLFRGSHIRIDVVYRLIPRKIQVWLDVLAIASMLMFGALLAWYAAAELVEALEYSAAANTPLRTPLWIPLTAWVGGLISFAIAALALFLEALISALRGDEAHVNNIVGMSGSDGAIT